MGKKINKILGFIRPGSVQYFCVIWITDPQSTEPEYLYDTNNASY
jgi:hypothetical protein